MSDQLDIIIVGAGLVGTSIALALKNLGLSILILENHLPSSLTDSKTDSRPISLSYGSQRILQALGVWDVLAKEASPILSVHVSEKNRFGVARFTAQEEQVPALGYVVPFAILQAALYQLICAQKNISILPIQTIEKIHCEKNGVKLEIQTAAEQQFLEADLLIATDGTHSTCRELLHFSTMVKNTGDIAHIYRLTLSEPHDHTAYERFTKQGVLAVLPLQDQYRAQLVWTITPIQAKKIENWDHQKIVDFLQECFAERLSIKNSQKFAEFLLQTVLSEKQITNSAVLLGNAAHTIYPLAAQGFNLALQDVAALADVIIEAHHNHQSIGALSTLKKYESAVQNNQEKILKMTNSLVTLFDLPFMGCARGLGLLVTDLIFPVKNKLAKRAMGIAEKLSNLLRDHR